MGNITKQYHYFDKIQKTCLKNQCKCRNGTPNQDKCQFSGLYNCKSCDDGFHFTKNQYLSNVLNRPIRECSLNTCKCENGEASNFLNRPKLKEDAEIFGCPEHNLNHCAKCNNGFKLDEDFNCVKEKVCTCNNGKRAIGENCSENKEICSSCDSGFSLSFGKCVKNSTKKKKINKIKNKLVKKLLNVEKKENDDDRKMAVVDDFRIPGDN